MGGNLNINIPPSNGTPLQYMTEVNTILMETEIASPREVHEIISSLLGKKSDIKNSPIFMYQFLNNQISEIIFRYFSRLQ